MKQITRSGAALAAAALTLAVTGAVFTAGPAAAAEKVKCLGVNACKGQGATGQNACKGQGVITTSADQCKAWGGKIQS